MTFCIVDSLSCNFYFHFTYCTLFFHPCSNYSAHQQLQHMAVRKCRKVCPQAPNQLPSANNYISSSASDSQKLRTAISVCVHGCFSLWVFLDCETLPLTYTPGFWQVVKLAWVQYLAVMVVFLYALHWVQGFVFHNQIILTIRHRTDKCHTS